MQSPTSWSELSFSSRRALIWAGALARYRSERLGEDPSSAAADSFDLLLGMLLEHPENAEPQVLLEHFGLVPGQLLPADYPRPAPDAIDRHLQSVSTDQPPPMQGDLSTLVDTGLELGRQSGSKEVAELRALFAAMLESSNPAASALGALLAERGAALTQVSATMRDYVMTYSASSDLAKVLRERHPFRPQPIDIPNYKADHGEDVGGLDQDMVGIQPEVDAFAYLLASRGLSPPLAVGLFGDWGSGKSFFMNALRKRIDRLTGDPRVAARPQAEVPFWKRIIQIRFNAWHYVEGELWASIVDHIFNQLKLSGEAPNLVEQRRKYWLEQIDKTRARLLELQSERASASRKLRERESRADILRQKRDAELTNLESLKAQATADIILDTSVEEVQGALDDVLISIGVPTADRIFAKIEEARNELGRARVLFESLWRSPRELATVVALLVAVPLVVWIISMIEVSALVTAFAGVSAAATAVIASIGRAMAVVEPRYQKLKDAEEKVRREIDSKRTQLQDDIAKAQESVDTANGELSSIIEEQQTLAAKLKTVQSELEKITPARVLTDFIAERVGSGDYRKHLGVPALIQQDFRQLAGLIKRQNEEILNDKQGRREQQSECFNRVILYIDDLDRCPDEHVVAVLQAVHLLLAFELFVVVVAVDSRWLCHALTKHFDALGMDGGDHEATPDDYLEKIFQIPFWVQPLDDAAKRSIVQTLLRGHLKSTPGDDVVDRDADRPTVGSPQRLVLGALDPAGAPPNLDAAALAVTPEDLRFLDELVPLLGTTPRSAKRFVNLYQLVRVIYRLEESDADTSPADSALLPFVLALGEGLPRLGPIVLQAATDAREDEPFEALLDQVKMRADSSEVRRLEDWLALRPDWKAIPARRLSDAFRKIERFLLRVGSLHRARPASPNDGQPDAGSTVVAFPEPA